MSANILGAIDRALENKPAIKGTWDSLKSAVAEGRVVNRAQAYVLFSSALKLSNAFKNDRNIRGLWRDFLERSGFTLDGTDRYYDFTTILNLFDAEREKFQISWVQIGGNEGDLETQAEEVHSIASDALGNSPGAAFFKKKLGSPVITGVIARCEETPIACLYGTYVDALKLFHVNFLGRKISFPGVHIVENLQSQIGLLRERFPEIEVITLKVDQENIHAKGIYESMGFTELETVPGDSEAEIRYFFGKKLVEATQFPTYEAFTLAYDAVGKAFI